MIKTRIADVDTSHNHDVCLQLSQAQNNAPKEAVVPRACKILIYARKTDDYSEMLSLLQEMILYINQKSGVSANGVANGQVQEIFLETWARNLLLQTSSALRDPKIAKVRLSEWLPESLIDVQPFDVES